jgi:hypothetical protein
MESNKSKMILSLADEIVEFTKGKTGDLFIGIAALNVAYLAFAPDAQRPPSNDPV